MLEPQLSPLVVAAITETAGRSADLRQALESIVNDLLRTMGTRALVVARRGAIWTPILGLGAVNNQSRVTAYPIEFGAGHRVATVIGAGKSQATAISLSRGGEHELALLLDGNWTGSDEMLELWSLALTYALDAVRSRAVTQRAERRLVRSYAMARRLSRAGDVNEVARRVVAHIAQLLDAERVSLSLYRQADACLIISATHGYALASMDQIRIKPGDWVIGHVYATKRPLFVSDVRRLSGRTPARDDYRTFSFAAVPVIAGSQTIGVLTVTDKRDGSAFGRQDTIALRSIGAWAGIALVAAQTATEHTRLAYAATIDSLTGLLNRPYLDSRLHQEVERAKRESGTLALLIADIDDFKSINDKWGHQVGDAVLQTVGSVIRSAVRVFDVCARYGGDEFAIVMPNSGQASAVACAERIRRRLAEHRASDNNPQPQLTMSIGVALIAPEDSAADLILRADRAMYQAKADGKNLVRGEGSAVTPIRHEPVDRSPRPIATGPPAVDAVATADEYRMADLPYVLVADADRERAAFCVEAGSGGQLGMLVAQDSAQAVRVIERFGPPVLLIVDLALAARDGFALLDAVPRDAGRRPRIIAWAGSRDMREYAASRLSGFQVQVLSDTAPRAAMRAAIANAIAPQRTAGATPAAESGSESDDLRQQMTDLSNRARQLCGTPGVAVYMKAPGDTRFRATFAWISDDLMPHSPHHLPRAFERITQTGESIVSRDLRAGEADAAAAGDGADAVRGLAGVPIVSHGELLGAICVFDIKPLQISESSLTQLRLLGHVTISGARVMLPGIQAAPYRDRVSDRDRSLLVVNAKLNLPPAVDWPPSLLERSGGEFAVAREMARARREGYQLSVVLFDCAYPEERDATLDDSTISTVTETLLRAIRQSDLPIRWSGTELLVVLPGLADSQARTVAERVRAALHAGARHRMAISGGVAELNGDERFGDVVDRARQKVAVARGRGHNRVN
ncbi:MAG: diguanylate cyclase [Vicinamibacterales bacterium]